MTKPQLEAMMTTMAAQLAALSPTGSPAATAPAGWLAEGSASLLKAAGKAAKAVSVTPTYHVTRAAFTPKGGSEIVGYRVVKMFGDEPDRRRPDGKFITTGEYNAIRLAK